MAQAARRAVLRDYFGPRGAHVSALADWRGDPAPAQGLFYRLGDRILKANNDLVARITGIPAQMRDNLAILADPLQRKLLARALVDEELLTTRRRRALLSISLWAALALAAAVFFGLFLFDRAALPAYESVYTLAIYSLLTSLFLPTPFELLLPSAVGEIGVPATVFVASVAKTIGAYAVLLMGDRANAGINQLIARRRLLARIFHALERFAQRFGYVAVFVLFAIPFMTDTAPLFALAVLRMRKGPFLAVMCVAIAVRSLLYLGVAL